MSINKSGIVLLSALFVSICVSYAATPSVSKLAASQRSDAGLVDISYDLWDADSDLFGVSVLVYTMGTISIRRSAL